MSDEPHLQRDEHDILSNPDVQPFDVMMLYRHLERDGTAWRKHVPDSAGLEHFLNALSTQQEHGIQQSPLLSADTLSQQIDARLPASTTKGDIRMPQSRLRTLIPAVAMLAIVIMLLGVFAYFRSRTSPPAPGSSKVSTSTSTPKGWVRLPQLDSHAEFDANIPPAIAPTDPQVVYETFAADSHSNGPSSGASMRRTDDGGKTWHQLPLPVDGTHIQHASVIVSPLDAHMVFLSFWDNNALADCPADLRLNNSESGGQDCILNYRSPDGGLHWNFFRFPFSEGGNGGEFDRLSAQGTRLFDFVLCADFQCEHIVTSTDGGQSWQMADQQLKAATKGICHIAVSPTGSAIFAVTDDQTDCDWRDQATRTIWESVDAGLHWQRNGTLPTPNAVDLVATSSGPSTTLLYALDPDTIKIVTDKTAGATYPETSKKLGDLRVSADGGKSWSSAPALGLPAEQQLDFDTGIIGTLENGRIVLQCIPPTKTGFGPVTLIAWKAGDSQWRTIAPTLPPDLGALVVTPSKTNAQGTLWAITQNRDQRSSQPTFMFQRYDG